MPCAEITFMRDRATEVFDLDVLRVIQGEFAHEIMVGTIKNDNTTSGRYLTGVPVVIRYGATSVDASTFVGYVHHAKPHYTKSESSGPTVDTQVVCIGASLRLQPPSLAVWSQRTIPTIVLDVLNNSLFTGEVQSSDRLFDTIVWRGEPGWVFLCSLARRLGWTCYATNTEIHFHDRERVIQSAALAINVPASTIHEFREIRGDLSAAGNVRANRVAYGLDPRTLRVVSASNNAEIPVIEQLGMVSREPLFTQFETGLALSSPGEASDTLASLTEENRWHIQAQLEMDGNERIRPARMVSVDGLNKQSDGFWYVPKVQHEVTSTSFTTFVDLGRDSSGDTGQRAPSLRRRTLRQRFDPFGTVAAATPPSILVKGVWRSAWQAQREVNGV